MGKTHVYFKPFADDFGLTYASTWTEVTNDVEQIGDLSMALDNTQYDLGIFRAQNLQLTMRNESGKYSDVDETFSMFVYTRARTQVKITWEPANHGLYAGFFLAGGGSIVSEEITIFQGVLEDVSTKKQLSSINVALQVMGYDSLLQKISQPTGGTALANGQVITTAIYNVLNQAPFNALVTVSSANINAASTLTGIVIDDATKFTKDQTALDVLNALLLAINAVLFIKGTTVYVAPRTVNSGSATEFYGAGSVAGNEDVLDIDNFNSGMQKLFTYWTWDTSVDNSTTAQNSSNLTKYGNIPKSVKVDSVTNGTNKQNILNSFVAEFGVLKRELDMQTKFSPKSLTPFLLDPVAIDLPGTPLNPPSQPVAFYGIGQYGVNYYADMLNTLFINPVDTFKIMALTLSFKDQTVTYSLRAA